MVALCLGLSSCADGGFKGGTREFSGVWIYEFEGSTFVEGATEIPTIRPPYEDADWLEWSDQLLLENLLDDRPGDGDCHLAQPFRVTFVGHRIHHPLGGAGHLGLWRSQVTVRRTLSAERLGPSFCYGDEVIAPS